MLGQLLLGKYRVTRLIDEGGMSKIYLARQVDQPRDVVIKVLKESLRGQTKTVEHFRREIYISTRFQHPHSVLTYDSSGKEVCGPILVMEYLRGTDLNTLLHRDGAFTPERTGRLLAQLGGVLQAAHEQGIVHRDIKPGNLMILHAGTPQETLKLMDFGLAKMTSMLYISPDELFDFNLPPASGTPEYISPEMVRGNDMDGRGDLYSVGVVLFEMLTGQRPFLHHSVEMLMLAHANERPPTFAELGMGNAFPRGLEAVVRSCLAKYPDQRPKNAWELVLAYEKALGRRITQAHTATNGSNARQVAAPPAPGLQPTAPTAVDRNAFRHSIEASMPEVMALIKLKGFVSDLGGEVVESIPGMIKVRLLDGQADKKKEGLFGWVSSSSSRQTQNLATKSKVTDLELHMERRDPSQIHKLTITLVMRPTGGLATSEWRNRCAEISRDLQAYLMGR
jgi:serine/threonine-protein kinase